MEWLNKFLDFNLNDSQKQILFFVREVGAVDNVAARQINGYKSTTANIHLMKLTQLGLLTNQGKKVLPTVFQVGS